MSVSLVKHSMSEIDVFVAAWEGWYSEAAPSPVSAFRRRVTAKKPDVRYGAVCQGCNIVMPLTNVCDNH
jgi:hypothetical protein